MTEPATDRSAARRAAAFVLFTLLGVLVGAVGLLAILMPAGAIRTSSNDPRDPTMSGSPSGTSTPATGMSASPSGSSTPATGMSGAPSVGDILEMHLPADVSDTCKDGGDKYRSVADGYAYADVDCSPDGWDVEYAAFHDAVAMRTRFALDVKRHEAGSGDVAHACRDALGSSHGPFWMSITRANHGASPHQLRRGHLTDWTHGAVLCFSSGGTRTIEWYDSDTHIYAWAQGSSDATAPLFNWWINHAGPNHPPMSDMRLMADPPSSPSPSNDPSPSTSESGSDMS